MSIEVRDLTHTYMEGTLSEVTALSGISFSIQDGEFVGLIGATGSGKSTLIQHLNGLLKPTSGMVLIDGVDIWSKGVSLKKIRQKIGLVFQYPEQQVFEETVLDDIAFGPRNLGFSQEEIEIQVEEARRVVGLDRELLSRSPFELSGGQVRRVAIAGILATKPKVLILDEPAAGLDPRGRREILDNVKKLHGMGMTVILVSHNMDDVARFCQRIMILNEGRLVTDASPREVFSQGRFLESLGLKSPDVTVLMERLKDKGWDVREDVLTVEEAYREIMKELRGRGVQGVLSVSYTHLLVKAKEAKSICEKMITIAKEDSLSARRRALAFINKEDVVKKLFETIGPRYAHRSGGYTRIIQTRQRRGDGAPMAILELVKPEK